MAKIDKKKFYCIVAPCGTVVSKNTRGGGTVYSLPGQVIKRVKSLEGKNNEKYQIIELLPTEPVDFAEFEFEFKLKNSSGEEKKNLQAIEIIRKGLL